MLGCGEVPKSLVYDQPAWPYACGYQINPWELVPFHTYCYFVHYKYQYGWCYFYVDNSGHIFYK